MASKSREVSIIGKNFPMFCDDICFGGKGAEDVGELGCEV
jgi:hypothetical protein